MSLVKITMSKAPATSQVTPFGETWFVFRDGEREIVAHNSLLSKESVFMNRKLVSENRSLSRIGKHQFIFEGNEYEVIFNVLKISKGEMECSLMKDGTCIQKFITYYKSESSKLSSSKKFIIGFVIMIFASSFAIFFKIPPLFPSITGAGIYLLITNKGGKIVIEKATV
jgi:hypothetical protein